MGTLFAVFPATNVTPEEENFSMDAGFNDLVESVRRDANFNFFLKAPGFKLLKEDFVVSGELASGACG